MTEIPWLVQSYAGTCWVNSVPGSSQLLRRMSTSHVLLTGSILLSQPSQRDCNHRWKLPSLSPNATAVMSQTFSVALNGVTLAIAVSSTVLALHAVLKQLQSGKPKDRFYEDIDGVATPKSLAKFFNKGPKIAILFFSVCGLSTSLGVLVLSTLQKGKNGSVPDNSLRTASWVSYADCTLSFTFPTLSSFR